MNRLARHNVAYLGQQGECVGWVIEDENGFICQRNEFLRPFIMQLGAVDDRGVDGIQTVGLGWQLPR